jgi:RHS repeat-associated protein
LPAIRRRPSTRINIAVAALLALAVPLSSVSPATAASIVHAKRSGHPKPLPVQRSGSAAGLAHEAGSNKNSKIPASARSRHPLVTFEGSPKVDNHAHVVPVKAAAKHGFDSASSRELPDRRTATQQTYANSDGTETTVLAGNPINYRDGNGHWQPIKPILVSQPGTRGVLTSAGGPVDVQLSEQLTGDAPLATVDLDADHAIGWGVSAAGHPIAQVAGGTAKYAGFTREADLELATTATGVKETIVLRSASAPASFTFPLQLKGITAKLGSDGQIVLSDAAGKFRAGIPAGFMTDAAGTTSTAVRYRLSQNVLTVSLDRAWLTDPARKFPIRVDPSVQTTAASSALSVGPSGSSNGANTFDVGPKAAGYVKFDLSSLANETIYGAQLSVVDQNAASCKARAVTVYAATGAWSSSSNVSWPGPSYSSNALASQSFAYGYVPPVGAHSTACPVKSTLFNLGADGAALVQRWVNGSQANNGLTIRANSTTDALAAKTFAGPSSANPPRLYVTHSPYNAKYSIPNPNPAPPVLLTTGGNVKVTVTNTSAMTWTAAGYYLGYRIYDSKGNPAKDNNGNTIGLVKAASLPADLARNSHVTLTAAITSPHVKGVYTLDFTMVKSGSNQVVFTDEQVPPGRLVLQVFDVPPVITAAYPQNGYQTPTLTPQLWAQGKDIDALSGSTLSYNYKVCPGTDMSATTCFTSGFQSSPGWVVPAGKLSWGKTYGWYGQVKDASSTTTSPTITLLTSVPQPAVVSDLAGAPYSVQDREFDPLAGNFSTGAIDATVSTSGPDLNVARTYNSLDPRTDGAFGAGWTSSYDMKVTAETDGSGNMLVTLPSGQQVRFGKNPDGTWTGPSSRQATFTLVNSTYVMKDESGSSYTFSLSGKLQKIQGAWGNPVTLTYAGDGTLASVKSGNSGRTLTFTWSGGHVATVASQPVNGVTATWSYTYSGDTLTKVCAPDNSCTSYSVVADSHYRTAVLDAKPDSYWQLGEDSGTEAGSAVAVNLGKDSGSYQGSPTLAAAGAIAGSPDTAVTLSGTSQYVNLPTGTAKKSRDMAVELWFKTTTSGPLFGYQEKALTASSANGVPLLYVGTDGKLRGQFRTGTVAPITSPGTVNNGAWHHVVLSAMGSTQTLYLDGTSAGTLTGTIDHANLTYAQLGAAYATGTWPGYPSGALHYFTGSIDEAAVYSHPLGSDVVAAHYKLGTRTANVISQITMPSGKIASAVSYDPATDRVAGYTDKNGGSWQLGAPLVTGDDKDLRRTVLVSDPAGRPYLYEFDALTGWLLRAGTPSGQTVRTEDQNCAVTPTPADPAFCAQDGSSGASQVIDFSGMLIRTYDYNDDGTLKTVTDENGDPSSMTYDAHGNVLTKTNCRTSATDCHTTYYSYPTGLTDPLDPRWDKPLTTRDARSISATDNNYLTSYSYDSKGDLQSQTSPDAGLTKTAYSSGVEAAYDSGSIPSGLPVSSTDARNAVTKFSYYANGDLAQITEPSGLITRFAYDALGRKISETEISDSYPAGVTSSYSYDAESRLTSTTEPATTDAVTGTRHQQQVNQTYDADGNVTRSAATDLLGGDATRTTDFTYDDHNRLASVVNPNGDEISYDYDKFGNKIGMTDAVGDKYDYAYTARNTIAEVRLRDPYSDGSSSYLVLTSYAYDPSGRLAYQSDSMGHRIRYEYYHDDLVHRKVEENFHNPDGTTREYVLEDDSYDAAGNLTRQAAANGTSVSTFTLDNVGRVKTSVLGTGTVTRTVNYTYDLNGNTTKVVATGSSSNLPWFNPVQAQTTSYVYDSSNRATTETVDLGSGASSVTTTGYDQRGNVVAIIDPLGNVSGAVAANYTTNYGYDELSRQVSTTLPAVSTEQNGAAPVIQRPQAVDGFDTFDEPVESKDPAGNIVTTGYDQQGNVVARTLPAYTPPGSSTAITPSSSATYDGDGRMLTSVDTRGFTTRYSYDRLGDLTTLDEPNSSDTDRAITRYTYTHTGQLLSTTDPSGAVTQQTYDDLDRPLTATQVERYPSLQNYTSSYTYDDNGNVVSATSPSGAVTTSSYDGLGQLTSVTDPNGVATQYGYDGMGNQTRISDGLGRFTKSVYDLGGRLSSETDLDSSLTALRSQSYAYDVDGNLLTSTPGNGHPTSYTYDNVGQLTKQVDPVSDTKSITTSFGYDGSGNRTRYTDGRGNATIFTFNSLGLPESVIEPATSAQPALAERTWTAAYDAASEPITMTAPGGVVRQRTYDASGRLTMETGSGAETSTAAKRIGYDVLGRLTSIGAGGGTDTYTYNDRGMQLSASGPSGAASYSYNADGLPSQRTDASGTADYTYTNGRLSAETDPVSGSTETVGYDAAGATTTIGYGAGRVRSYGYDNLGRLATDTLKNAAGSTVTSTGYGYDQNNNVTSKVTAGVQGAGSNSYSYDYLDRMTSWTDPAGATTNYGWDDSSNRILAGGKAATYDERNRLLSDGTSTYSYSARGSLQSKTTGTSTENFSFDAFDRLITDGSQNYSYDDLDRLSTDSGQTLKYAGTDPGVVSDGTSTYGRDVGGDVISEQTGTTKRSLIADQHGDVVGGFDPSDTSLSQLADSRSYDPWGNVTAATPGATYSVGFQGSWTDSDTGQVDMGTRWYSPATGDFDSQDSTQYLSGASSLANKYLYGAGNPITNNDPDGNWPHCGICHKAMHAVTHTVSKVVHTVGGWVSSGASTVASWAGNAYDAAAHGLSTAWNFTKHVASAAWDLAKTAYHAVSHAVSWVYHKAVSAVHTVVHAVSYAASWVADKAQAAAHWAAQKAQEAAAAAHRAAVAVSNATKSAIRYAVQHNPLPAIAAAVKPLMQTIKKVVSTVASIPAAVVSVTVNVVKEAAASVQAVYQAAVTAAGAVVQAVSTAVDAVATFATDHWKTIAAFAAGAATFLGCEGLSLGIGSAGCLVAAAAVGGAVGNALNCPPGHSIAGCAAKGALAGGIGGALTVATGGAGAVVAGALGAAGENTALQYLNTGQVDIEQVAESAAVGGVMGGIGGRAGAEEDSGAASFCKNSFIAGTPVLMADGSQKPIDQVHKGDQVLATDPETGVTSAEAVVTPIVHAGPHTMVDVSLSDGSSITATDQHPFWDDTEHAFVNAIDLHSGDKVLTSSGKRLFVKAIVVFVAVLAAFNLQIDKIHTYYAGATPVLVHNACGPASDNYRGRYNADLASQGKQRLPADMDAHHAVPQYYQSHPEFSDFDFHAPSNIRGVQGSRSGPGNNVHQDITNEWSQFQRTNPGASRSQIEDFAGQIDVRYGHRFWTG